MSERASSVPLSVRGLRAGYGPVEVLHGIDLDVAPGCITAIVGRNGAGKTTVLSCLAGVHPIEAGSVRLRGVDVTRLPAYRRAQRGILLIPDRGAVFASLTVEQNLQLFAGDSPLDPALAAFPVLEQRLRQIAGTLSGGEQQMLALSPALLRPFTVLLVDELSRGLAPQIVAELYATLARLAQSGAAIAVVEHHEQLVHDLVRFVYAVHRGRVIFGGEPADLAATSA